MEEIQKLKESILKDYPKLNKKSPFKFECHRNISCFNKCCSDVNIFLTPYDIIRLKNNLNIPSQEFLDRYTLLPIDKNQNHPVVLLKMEDNENKTCPFVSEEGCSVYEDRPWSCRMFPLGAASPKEVKDNKDSGFYFLLRESVCKGYEENKDWTVEEWMQNQEVDDYAEMGELFKGISLHDYFDGRRQLTPSQQEMFYTVCYNIDKFREFVFGSTFLKRFRVEKDVVDKIKKDDTELLKFGFKWLRFCLFGEKTMELIGNQ